MAYFCILLKVSSKNCTFGQRLLSLGPGRFVLISFQIKGLCHEYAPLGPWLGQETYKLGFFLFIGAGGTVAALYALYLALFNQLE